MALESEALLMTYSLHLIGYNKPLTHHSGTANMEKLLQQPTSIFVRRTEIDFAPYTPHCVVFACAAVTVAPCESC